MKLNDFSKCHTCVHMHLIALYIQYVLIQYHYVNVYVDASIYVQCTCTRTFKCMNYINTYNTCVVCIRTICECILIHLHVFIYRKTKLLRWRGNEFSFISFCLKRRKDIIILYPYYNLLHPLIVTQTLI